MSETVHQIVDGLAHLDAGARWIWGMSNKKGGLVHGREQ